MCWCNSNTRTPCCGGVNCYPHHPVVEIEEGLNGSFDEAYTDLSNAARGLAKEFSKVMSKDFYLLAKAAIKTLESLDYTWDGGELWKPPTDYTQQFNPKEKYAIPILEMLGYVWEDKWIPPDCNDGTEHF